jgi:hypothetical protein
MASVTAATVSEGLISFSISGTLFCSARASNAANSCSIFDREANSDLLDLAVVMDLVVDGFEATVLALASGEAVTDVEAFAFGFTGVALGVVGFGVVLVAGLVSTFFAVFEGGTSSPMLDMSPTPAFFGRPRF